MKDLRNRKAITVKAVDEMTIQRFKRLKKSKKYQSLIRLFDVRKEPIS